MGPNYEAYTVRVLTFEDGRGAKHRLRFYQAGEEKRFRTWRKAGGRTPERQAALRPGRPVGMEAGFRGLRLGVPVQAGAHALPAPMQRDYTISLHTALA